MDKKTFVIGAGGLARELRALFRSARPTFDVTAFVDLAAGPAVDGIPVISEAEFLTRADGVDVLLGLGTSPQRERFIRKLDVALARVSWPTVIHPSATIDDRDTVRFGRGCTIAAGVRITTSVTVGEFTHLNLNVTVGHDSVIGPFTVVNPSSNLSGGVTLEDAVQIGTGAQVLPGLRVGARAEVGAGAVVTRDVAPGLTVVGIPARPLVKQDAPRP